MFLRAGLHTIATERFRFSGQRLKMRESVRAVRLSMTPSVRIPQLTDEPHIPTGQVMYKVDAINNIEELKDQL